MPETNENKRSYLNFPPAERQVFDQNFLDRAIIELRFPTLLSLKDREPTEMLEAIRPQFPNYDPAKAMEMTQLGPTKPEPIYKCATRKTDYVMELTASHIVLITQSYKSFEDFRGKIEYLIEKFLPYLKTDFFTRIGLRYVNQIAGFPNSPDELREWINPALVAPISCGEINALRYMKSEITGNAAEDIAFSFKYGISPPQDRRTFVLDYDYGKQDVDADQVISTLESLYEKHFDFFWWSLGESARKALKDGTAKRS